MRKSAKIALALTVIMTMAILTTASMFAIGNHSPATAADETSSGGDATISGRIVDDADCDGTDTPTDPGLPNVKVCLYDPQGNLLQVVDTDNNGSYQFTNVAAGDYTVELYPQNIPDSMIASFDPDGVLDDSTPISVQKGDNLTGISFGYKKLSALGDFVFDDLDRDGIQDPGEPGVSGVRVNVRIDSDGNGAPDTKVCTALTDANGKYLAERLDPRETYFVQFILPDGKEFTIPNQGGNDAKDSDVDPSTGYTGPIHLSPGQTDLTNDAGLIMPTKKGSIGDRVWSDTDGDGIQDPNEPGISGVTVKLRACDRSWLDQTVTDANGFYLFDKLDAGCYLVQFVKPDGTDFSPTDQGNNDAIDSDAKPNGFTNEINLSQGEDNLTIDAGVVTPKGSIGDRVWNDLDRDGIQDPNEPGFASLPVELKDCDGNILATTTTVGDGFYLFDNLDAGCYIVGFVAGSGFVFSPKDQGNDDAVDSDGDPNTGMTDPINLGPGEDIRTVDGGVHVKPSLGSLGDRVWNDQDQDGIQDPNEPGVSGVTVQLKDCGGTILQTTTTDGNGNYLFSDLDAGCYIIGVVLPNGFNFSPANQGGNDAADSDIDPATAMTGQIDLAPGEDDLTNDAGLVTPLVCGLSLTHTCEVAAPPSDNLLCTDKIAAARFRYTGPSISGATVVFTGKDGGNATYTNVDLVSGVTELSAQNGYSVDARPNDLGSKTSIFINGVEEIIHTSCSAIFAAGSPAPLDGNSPPVTGNPNPNKGDPSPNWFVESFVQKDGRIVSEPAPQGPAQQCTINTSTGNICGSKGKGKGKSKKPDQVTFRYTGGDCSASNNAQGSKAKCSGSDPNPSQDTNITVQVTNKKGATFSVKLGEEFSTKRDDAKKLTLNGPGGTQQLEIHMSCSQPLNLGDVYGGLTLVGADGQRMDSQVTLTYEVFNSGNDLSNVNITDDIFGSVAGPFLLLTDQRQTFVRQTTIEQSISNTAVAQGTLANGVMCMDSSTVDLTVQQAPAGNSCADSKPTALTFEYTGESCSASNNGQGNKFDCSGTPGSDPAQVVITKDASKISVDPNSVSVGDTFTISRTDGKKFGSETKMNVGNQSLNIHTSCSQPLAVGDQFGSLILREFFPEGSSPAASNATDSDVTALETSNGSTFVFLPLVQE